MMKNHKCIYLFLLSFVAFLKIIHFFTPFLPVPISARKQIYIFFSALGYDEGKEKAPIRMQTKVCTPHEASGYSIYLI